MGVGLPCRRTPTALCAALAAGAIPITVRTMKRLAAAALAVVLLLSLATMTGGCRTKKSGSREFIPGTGWTPAK